MPNPATVPSTKGALVYPDDDGSANWFSPSYSPRTGLFYQNVCENRAYYFKTETQYQPGRVYVGAFKREIPNESPYGTLRALRALSRETAWEFRMHSPPWGGLLATAGDLVFSGTMEGDFFALDAVTGKLLWRIQTGGEIWANPMSYQFGGQPYVAIAAGSALLVFAVEP